jgi:hypothetical protein
MIKKHMKKYSISLDIKEMQIKITLRFHLIPIRTATIKSTMTNVGKNVRKKELSNTAGGKVR